MNRIEPNPSAIPTYGKALSRASRGEVVRLHGGYGSGKTYLASSLAKDLDAHLLSISEGVDAPLATVLQLASSFGLGSLVEVARAVHEETGRLDRALDVLEDHRDDRPIVVVGLDHLATSADELDGVFEHSRAAVLDWVKARGLVQFSNSTAHGDRIEPPQVLPFKCNGFEAEAQAYWEAVDRDLVSTKLALSHALVAGVLPSPHLSRHDLAQELLELASGELAQVMEILAAHARPISPSVVAEATVACAGYRHDDVQAALDRAIECLFVDSLPDGRVALAGEWSHLATQVGVAEHLALARSFREKFELGDPDIHRAAPAVVEAMRHYSIANEPEQARGLRVYGVEWLVAHARSASIAARRDPKRSSVAYARAAEVYELVLEHDREHGGKTGSQAGIEPRLRAYCQHYLHYNRAKMAEPSREPIRATEAGYREALVDWPGHAVFWSRLVLCLFIQKRRNEAWAALLEAEASVQEHRDKQRKLYARTVTRLLQRSMVSEALWVWGDRTAITLAKGLLAQSSLERALAEGWRDDRMWLPERRDVAFTEDMPHRLTAVESGWAATLQDLQLTSRGETRIAAFCRLAHNVRETVSTALTTLTTQLSAAGRLRKGILLARVDLHLSGLAVEAGEFAWLVGSVVRSEENQRVFKPLDGAGTLLDLAPELQDRVTVAPELILAKVRRSLPGGPASGPVVGVEELPAMPEEEVEPFLRSILNG